MNLLIQLRNNDATPEPGVPHVVVREAMHAHLEPPTVIEVHVRNEEFTIVSFCNLEQEESSISISPKLVAVVLGELLDLML